MQKDFSFFWLTDINKDGKFEIRIPFDKDDWCKLLRYEQFLRTCIEKGFRPRPNVLRQFGELLEKSLVKDFETRQLFFSSIKEGINLRIAGTEYDFKIQNQEHVSLYLPLLLKFASKQPATEKKMVEYTFQEFLDRFFNRIASDESFEEIVSSRNKAKFVEDAFSELYDYLKNIPDKSQPSFYRYTVIVGYLAAGFGLVITEEEFDKSPSNHSCYTAFLNNVTRHICRKTKEKKERERKPL